MESTLITFLVLPATCFINFDLPLNRTAKLPGFIVPAFVPQA